ncbi:MAG: LPS ABC transporter substrate-binding protein LptA [Candidatus Tokpelaia sp.]|nr:MAG: LPS ABC transporter substrate-binding protein LptA [Candidatus Tokpelaia sp.]KAA6206007.1 MAG: LPS ABC transporter substrate-binding protein LptA [Candidatus Tokpelaia sp.]KAA6406188.1 LPS ABC transporter substrate-binding protein LptA [Candidatus Tokpelaia sp.]
MLPAAGFAWPGQAFAQNVNFGINLSGGKEPVKIDADEMEMHDKDGMAILTGNVSVAQGDRILRAGKMIVYYNKTGAAEEAEEETRYGEKANKKAGMRQANSLGASGIDRLEVSDKVYIKNGRQIAVGDKGVFNAGNNIMVLTGAKIVLTDGDNVATGCKLTAHMDSGKAFLESCSSSQQKGRVSVIVNRGGQN